MNLLGKFSGKVFFNRLHRVDRGFNDLLQRVGRKQSRQTGALGGLDEMSALNFVNFIMPAMC